MAAICLPSCALVMNWLQMAAGTLPPDRVVLVSLSLPSQTPVTMAEV